VKRLLGPAVVLFALICLVLPTMTCSPERPDVTQPAPDEGLSNKLSVRSGNTYTVLVGLEQATQGIDVMAYFPQNVSIHTGDTVHWVLNSNEIHTVTFPDGEAVPELLVPSASVGADPSVSPLAFNPAAVEQVPASGEYSGGIGAYANSGIMGPDPGQVQEFDLTFTATGTFHYICIVHGSPMVGTVDVVSDDEMIPSPNQALAEGRRQMAEALSLVPGVLRDAAGQVMPPEANGDGTLTHTVLLGYSETLTASYGQVQVDLVQFFPKRLTVRPGDTVTFGLSPENLAPHTATFLNGAEEPPLAVFQGGFLYLNPDVLFPSGGNVLARTGTFSSGLLLPGTGATYSLEIGEMTPGLEHFLCLLHDGSGMTGDLMVVPRD
jgi:plastocyanin